MERNPTTWSRREKQKFRQQMNKIQDAATRRRCLMIWHTALGLGRRRIADLLACLPSTVDRAYQNKIVIHVILDNDIIHSSRMTQKAVEDFDGRIVLHFLSPYGPEDNRIERAVWRELHANVTRNHRCGSIEELLGECHKYLVSLNRQWTARRKRAA